MNWRHWLLPLAIRILLLSTGHALGAPPALTAVGEIIHVSAGIGEDDAIEVEMLRRLHNLELVFALQGSGSYVADVKVSVYNAAGAKVLAAQSPGPLFFATLRPGQYRVDAEFRGRVLSKVTSVTQAGRRDLYFYWASE
ncbi:conserved exported hypothetical protein [Candidatus Accumulibacter aalborgensis]|uniref:Carboxypeptidase regulatory-like domain-containing protein n=1 Tax=Candidatus Accumulibacter aalborgensis TaxID=1860102 RepID=A0A1A8XH33_9PROT|nr:hypothetical protein [Candidatus Accumulibacter aalborgensis]SBT03682.1 conserved exported hypothetical protein [Candidatus Accumulibacter aalborgensis]